MSGWAILVVLLALFVVWHFIPEAKPPAASPKFRRDPGLHANNPQWRSIVEANCESPAEVAFLTAMIDAHGLQPQNGSLQTDGLRLDLQVQEGGYRADFLANEWLVIEIDGAAYHSSDDAKARDRQRDDDFKSIGYSVLRIPAKTVFIDPDEAVRQVSSALAVGKREIVEPVQASGFERLSQTMSGLGRAVEEINANIGRQRQIEAALSQPRLAFSTEKEVIDSALDSAAKQIEIDVYIGQSESRRESYERYDASLRKSLENYRNENRQGLEASRISITIPQFLLPLYVGDADTDTSIKAEYIKIVDERDRYLENARLKVQDDPNLGSMVRRMLDKMGCPEVWERIS